MMNRNDGTSAKSLNTLVFIITLLLVFIIAARTPIETDLGWHLRSGQVTIENGSPLTKDVFSYTRYGEKWINHSWLAQVIFYILYQAAGYLGIGLIVALAATASMMLTYMTMDGPALLRAFLIILASMVATWVWSARPQILSLLMLAGLAYLVYLYKWRSKDRLWVFIPLFILWSNLHGGYVLGFMFLLATIAGEVLNHLSGNRDKQVLSWKRIARLIAWSIGGGIAALINPNGLDTWLIPFQTVGVEALQQFISEWASPDFHVFAQQPLLWMVFGLLAAVGLSGRRIDGSDLLTVVLFGYTAFVARRNFGPFAIIAAPVLSRYCWAAIQAWWDRMAGLRDLFARINEQSNSKPVPALLRKGLNFSIVILLALTAYGKLFAVTYPSFVEAYYHKDPPAAAVDWLLQNNPQGRLLNSYNWGGFLIWRLPEYPVFVDGRTDLFGDEIIGEWMSLMGADEGWEQKLDAWEINLVLVEPDRPLVKELQAKGWNLLYSDPGSVIYGR